MKVEDLKRPDLAHTSCALCDEAWQSPEPPALPPGYAQAVAAGLPDKAIDLREAQAAAYRLDEAAFQATHDHAKKAHTLDEHLAHAHANRIPITCERCGREEQATAKGKAALDKHECGKAPRTRAYAE